MALNSVMLSVHTDSFIRSAANKTFMISVILHLQSVVTQNVIMLNVVAPQKLRA
jgi:hypothetical protein